MTVTPTIYPPTHREVIEPQLRLSQTEAQRALDTVRGSSVHTARARLRFGPGRTCEPLARVLDKAVAQADDEGVQIEAWLIAEGTAIPAQDIVRVRRLGFASPDWISSSTCSVRIIVGTPDAPTPPSAPTGMAHDSPNRSLRQPRPLAGDHQRAEVRQALTEVIDPDLGVNVVDLGFVRAIDVEDRTAVVTMTLTSPACPLTEVIESQVRDRTADLTSIDGVRVEWQWLPSWKPADVTESGRDQLRAVGFTI